MQITLNINVDERLIAAVEKLAGLLTQHDAREAAPVKFANQPEAPAQRKTAPQPEVHMPLEVTTEDMPDFNADHARQVSYTDAELMEVVENAVRGLRESGNNPTIIKTHIYSAFGISRALDCPIEKRAEFVAAVQGMAKDKTGEVSHA